MYLHIGKNCVIKDKVVIGVFNLCKIDQTQEYKNMYENMQAENRLEDISCNQKNSFILTENNNEVKGYISNIGTNTIRKRRIGGKNGKV